VWEEWADWEWAAVGELEVAGLVFGVVVVEVDFGELVSVRLVIHQDLHLHSLVWVIASLGLVSTLVVGYVAIEVSQAGYIVLAAQELFLEVNCCLNPVSAVGADFPFPVGWVLLICSDSSANFVNSLIAQFLEEGTQSITES
jgi:hypothetical protein